MGGNIIGNPPSYQSQTLFPNQPSQPSPPSYSGSGWYDINGNLLKIPTQSDFYNTLAMQGTTAPSSVGYIGPSTMQLDVAYATFQAENFKAANPGSSLYVEDAPQSLLATSTTSTTTAPAYSYGVPGQTFNPALASPQYGLNNRCRILFNDAGGDTLGAILDFVNTTGIPAFDNADDGILLPGKQHKLKCLPTRSRSNSPYIDSSA